MFYRRYLKRVLDVLLSIIAIILLSPLIFIIGVLVKCFMGSPIIFRHDRPGLNEEIFTMYKFRTMNVALDMSEAQKTDSVRLTKFGRFLRSTSLDELPELVNVIKGEMSLVGPRPLLVKYLPIYSERHKKRHSVRPGITGLAQTQGRNTISWEAKLDMDICYVNKLSFTQDMKIIALTFYQVLRRDGIAPKFSDTMEEFKGSNKIE